MAKLESKHFHCVHLKWVHLLLFLLLIIMLHHHGADAQSTMEPEPSFAAHRNWDSSVAIMIGALICFFLLMGIFSIYMRRCTEFYLTERNNPTTTESWPCSCSKGIQKEVLDTFPIVFYSTIKDLKIGKGALECAVCLSDFKDCETLRLLPTCNHVFHPDCVDAWLASHVTCPVCRAKLNQELGEVAIVVPTVHLSPNEMGAENENCGGRAELGDGENEIEQQHPEEHNANEEQSNVEEGAVKPNPPSKSNLLRSNSTGHSLVEPGKCLERYTLRLPEDVRRYILLNHEHSASYQVDMPMMGSSRKGCVGVTVKGVAEGR